MTPDLFHTVKKGKGEPLLFVHGSASDYRTWDSQVTYFSKFFQVWVFSRRYHWPNPKIPSGEDYSMAQQLEDLKAFVAYHGLSGIHLIGHSYGAFLCLLMAMQENQVIKTLTLAEPPVITLHVSSDPKPKELLRLFFYKPSLALALLKFGIKGIAPSEKAIKNNNPEKALACFGRATLGSSAYNALSQERLEQARNNFMKMELLGSGFLPLDKEKIKKIPLPVLLLSAEYSPVLFKLLINELELLIPQAEKTVIPGASHIMHEDNPTAYNRDVCSFLNKHR